MFSVTEESSLAVYPTNWSLFPCLGKKVYPEHERRVAHRLTIFCFSGHRTQVKEILEIPL